MFDPGDLYYRSNNPKSIVIILTGDSFLWFTGDGVVTFLELGRGTSALKDEFLWKKML